jgi:single-strand DNA-binding protein
MNRVILMGRTGSDPEVKEVGQNTVCKFSLATSESYKKDGQKITDTTWHNLIFWGKQCGILKQYLHKGDQLLVEGKIVIRKYDDKTGVTHWTTEIVCDKFEFIGGKKEENKPSENKSSAMSDIKELGEFPDEPF